MVSEVSFIIFIQSQKIALFGGLECNEKIFYISVEPATKIFRVTEKKVLKFSQPILLYFFFVTPKLY